jgi:riboflavin biosynthesis pyrimidine reductase
MSDLEPLALLSADAELGVVLPPGLRRLYGGDLALPERCLYANFVQTIDGVVAIPSIPDSNRLVSGGSDADRFVMGLLRAAADVVLIGSGTLRASAHGRWRPETVFSAAAEAFAELRHELGLEAAPRVAILTAAGSISPDRTVLEDGPIVLTTMAGAERLAGTLPAGVEIVTLPGEAEVDVTSAVELLRERGHRRILSEAGPHVFGSLVDAGLVDELFLTVSPLLAGRPSSGSFGLVEGAALLPDHPRPARLRSARAHGSHLFLQYGLR